MAKKNKIPSIFMMRFYFFRAFLLGRRKSMWLTFREGFVERFWFTVFKIFFSKNMRHERRFRKKSQMWVDDVFLFRDREDLRKFEMATKLSWKDDKGEKSRLYGEALGYPDFAIRDFVELGEAKSGDRISFKCFEWGYDGFVCRPEHFEKMKEWLISQKIPLEKVIVSNNDSGKWRHESFGAYEKRINNSKE